MAPTDRREVICAAAVHLLADGGARALSHGAIDRSLELPAGSTSYYYRTRRALVEAVAAHITARSRAHFEAALLAGPDAIDAGAAADLIADQLTDLVRTRRAEVLARYCLLIEAADDARLTGQLAACLFSRTAATELMAVLGGLAEANAAADDLIALLEGLLFDAVVGSRSGLRESRVATVRRFRVPVQVLLVSRR